MMTMSIVSIITVYLLTGCVTSDRYRSVLKQYETDTQAYKELVDELSKKRNELEAKLSECKMQNKLLEAELETQKEKYTSALKLSEKIRSDLEQFVKKYEGQVKIGPSEQLIIQDKLLFDPGKAVLKEEGQKALEDFVNDVLKGRDLYLRIVGHTDSDPITHTLNIWKTGLNHELGGARALAVLVYLHKKGVPLKNMHFESRGENEPVAPNDTKENKAKNRRVEIYIIEKEKEKGK
jgi:chemotaxis protein MotB